MEVMSMARTVQALAALAQKHHHGLLTDDEYEREMRRVLKARVRLLCYRRRQRS